MAFADGNIVATLAGFGSTGAGLPPYAIESCYSWQERTYSASRRLSRSFCKRRCSEMRRAGTRNRGGDGGEIRQ